MQWIAALFCAIFLVFQAPVFSWLDAGHMMVALIANEDLTAEAKQRIEDLLAVEKAYFPQTSDFVRASVWPDTLRARGLNAMNSWHFISLPYDPSHLLSAEEKSFLKGTHQSEIIFALNQCINTLQNPKAGQWEKAFTLRWVLHLVGDIHQPLHCTSLYSQRFPKGDRGGGLFVLASPYKNLHLLWDAAGGALPSVKYTDYSTEASNAPSVALRTLAQTCRKQYPRETFPELGEERLEAWAEESHRLGENDAYAGIAPGQTPSEEYLSRCREITARRMTLAGYRLADLLNKAFPGNTNSKSVH